MSPFDLSGRAALVTGSSRGLGFAMARGLAAAGARVILNARDGRALERAAGTLRAEGHRVETALFDVTDGAAAEAALAPVLARGPVDILVNNAGFQARAPVLDQTDETWARMFDVHVHAAVKVARVVAPGMVARRWGRIVNICSVMSEIGRPTVAPYTAAKGALKMLTKAMAIEFAPHGVQVNGIGPGYFATEMNAALIANPEFDAFVKRRTPAARWGRPEELAGVVVFLASDAASYVTGQVLYADGGMLAAL
jgi:gluconate 5-dehydrogenase